MGCATAAWFCERGGARAGRRGLGKIPSPPDLRAQLRRGLSRGDDASSAEPGAATGLLSWSLDFVSDWALLAYASWTLLAYFGMATGTRISILVPVWLLTVPLTALALLLLRGRARGPLPDRRARRLPVWPDKRRR